MWTLELQALPYLDFHQIVKKLTSFMLTMAHLDDPPRTLDSAVDRLISVLSAEEKNQVRNMPKDELILLHFGLGLQIRNAFGLHQDNNALRQSCGQSHPDDASRVILEALWDRLQIAD